MNLPVDELLKVLLEQKDQEEGFRKTIEKMAKAAGFASLDEYESMRREIKEKYPNQYRLSQRLAAQFRDGLGDNKPNLEICLEYSLSLPESLQKYMLGELKMCAQTILIAVAETEEVLAKEKAQKEASMLNKEKLD